MQIQKANFFADFAQTTHGKNRLDLYHFCSHYNAVPLDFVYKMFIVFLDILY